MMHTGFFFILLFSITSLFSLPFPTIDTSSQIKSFLTYDEKRLEDDVNTSLSHFHHIKKTVLSLKQDQRTMKNVILPLDQALGSLSMQLSRLEALSLVLTDNEKTEFLHTMQNKIEALFYDILLDFSLIETVNSIPTKHNIEKWKEKWSLSANCDPSQLSSLEQQNIKELFKKNSELSHQFSLNIQRDAKKTTFSKEQLQGLSDNFIESLNKSESGLYSVNLSYPIYVPIMKKCKTTKVREALHHLFTNRAYPDNITILEELISTRHQLATALHFKNYAELDLSNQMAQNPTKVALFLEKLINRSTQKATSELESLTKNHTELLTSQEKIYLHDLPFLFDQHKMKYHQS